MKYAEKLEATKAGYPFDEWRKLFYPNDEIGIEGMEQYSAENCDLAQKVLDDLIAGLILAGENAPEADKKSLFKTAIERLNTLNEEISGLIETGEREDLCALIDNITMAAGMKPSDYGDGEGIADEWREW